MIETISHYRILARLGAGGMGEVYLAEDLRLERKVAIKLLGPGSSENEQAKKRLIREARAAAKLDQNGLLRNVSIRIESNGIRQLPKLQTIYRKSIRDKLDSECDPKSSPNLQYCLSFF